MCALKSSRERAYIILDEHTHIHSIKTMKKPFKIMYQTPYNSCEWRVQWFATLEEAERMVEFYRSCRSPAKLM